jgi:hypothetical protein
MHRKIARLALFIVLTIYAAMPSQMLAEDSTTTKNDSLTINTSGGWSDPVNWGHAIKDVGLSGAVSFVIVLGSIIGGIYALRASFGEKGFIKIGYEQKTAATVSLLAKLEGSVDKQQLYQQQQLEKCDAHQRCSGDIRLAGHEAAEILTDIAGGIDETVEKKVKERVEKIHGILRGAEIG